MSASSDNRVRWRRDDRKGHLESYFLKANDPAGDRAIWVRFTLSAPVGRPEDTTAAVWAMAFDRRGGRTLAGKTSHPVRDARLEENGTIFALNGASLAEGKSRGSVETGEGAISWDLEFPPGAPPLHIFPSDALYEIRRFPRYKVLSPHPSSPFTGHVRVLGERWEVRDWPGMQGHNWGAKQALRYVWTHANAFTGAPGTYFEGASGQVVLGPITTPLVTMVYLEHAGRAYDFRGIRHWLNRTVVADRYRWSFAAANDEAELSGEFTAERKDLVGLSYPDPDGESAQCLNSKLAVARLTLSLRAGRKLEPVATLVADHTAALEMLAREDDPAVPNRC